MFTELSKKAKEVLLILCMLLNFYDTDQTTKENILMEKDLKYL